MAETFNPYLINNTYELIKLVETIKPPASFLKDTFFSDVNQSVQDYFVIESRKAGRVCAPFIFEGIAAKDVARFPHSSRLYKAPCLAARRKITLNDIAERFFGEQPIFSSMTPQDRAAKQQAVDMVDLMNMIANTQNRMCGELLQTGKITVSGVLADGTPRTDIIDFHWTGRLNVSVSWADTVHASIYDDLRDASERIQESIGTIPTIAICGKNVEKYLLANDEVYKWLLIPNRQNIALMNLEPKFAQPQIRFLGYLASLNLELYSYAETFKDGDRIKSFLDPDSVIIGSPKLGSSNFGRVDFLDMSGNWASAAAPTVPLITWDSTNQWSALTLFSRYLPIPDELDSWITLNVVPTIDDGDSDTDTDSDSDTDSD
ncbi:MAG: major capsid protein [Selenomonadaceae bacterium]|nr:major capsid protein [Selenomonadaceae bacterium]